MLQHPTECEAVTTANPLLFPHLGSGRNMMEDTRPKFVLGEKQKSCCFSVSLCLITP